MPRLLWVAAAVMLAGCRPLPHSEGPAGGSSGPPGRDPAARESPAAFADVAAAAGLDYRWTIGGRRPLNILQTIGNGCALFDSDQDGNLDILLVGPHPALYRGDGRGKFRDVSAGAGFASLAGHFLGCAVGDIDNDGDPDVYLTAYRGGALLRNEGGGVFADVSRGCGLAVQPWGTSAAFADVDNDGLLDLYVGDYVVYGPDIRPALCDFGGLLGACGPHYYRPERGALYRNAGGGRFVDVTRQRGAAGVAGKTLGVAWADFDGSGRQSLTLANDEVTGDLLRNVGRRFINIGTSSGTGLDADGSAHGGMGTDWGDYDNDGRLDLVVATFTHEAKNIYRNEDGSVLQDNSAALGVAERTLPYIAFGAKWFDFDNDGWLDLAFANGHVQDNVAEIDRSLTYRQPTQLFRNEQGARFADLSDQSGEALRRPIVGRGLAVGDYDNDGRVDVLVVDSEGSPVLLHNESPRVGHWVSLRLIGTRSNRGGVGAVVIVESGGMKQVRRCGTDGSYMSASDARVHIGLGRSESAKVTVRWPSGARDIHSLAAVDREYTLKEKGASSGR